MQDIAHLVESAQAGDSAAYEALIQRFQPMAYATAYRYLQDHHLAQDIVQEAVIEALVHLSQLKEPSAFPGWFRQIVFRQCTRMLRQPTVPSLSLEAASWSVLTECDPEASAVQREVQSCVRAAVAALPEPERLVTVLFMAGATPTARSVPSSRFRCRQSKSACTPPARSSKGRYRQPWMRRGRMRLARARGGAGCGELARTLGSLGDPVGIYQVGCLARETLFRRTVRLTRCRLSCWFDLRAVAYRPLHHPPAQQGDDAMSDERDAVPTHELQEWAEQLGDRDWRRVMEATTTLARAGQTGLDAVLWGLAHPNARVRRGCAGFLDHHATDACMPQLRSLALHDPAAKVRRVAVHSVTCQQCKPAPLSGDLVGLLVQVALTDPNRRVREQAIGGHAAHPPDARAVAALEQILRTEAHPDVRRAAHHALKSQDPLYKARVDAEARARGIAAASARQEQHPLRSLSKARTRSEARMKRLDTGQCALPYCAQRLSNALSFMGRTSPMRLHG
jgi:RNA polymerase sigma factor (sigma-70 family)